MASVPHHPWRPDVWFGSGETVAPLPLIFRFLAPWRDRRGLDAQTSYAPRVLPSCGLRCPLTTTPRRIAKLVVESISHSTSSNPSLPHQPVSQSPPPAKMPPTTEADKRQAAREVVDILEEIATLLVRPSPPPLHNCSHPTPFRHAQLWPILYKHPAIQ